MEERCRGETPALHRGHCWQSEELLALPNFICHPTKWECVCLNVCVGKPQVPGLHADSHNAFVAKHKKGPYLSGKPGEETALKRSLKLMAGKQRHDHFKWKDSAHHLHPSPNNSVRSVSLHHWWLGIVLAFSFPSRLNGRKIKTTHLKAAKTLKRLKLSTR